jgi:HlyD family secretion protein
MKLLGSLLFIFSFVIVFFLFRDTNEIEYQKVLVEKNSFDLKISTYGTLEASRLVQIKSHIPSNNAKILELIDEGTEVNKGEIISRLDITKFMEDLHNIEYKINESEALLAKAQKELDVFKRQSKDEVQKTQKSIQIAKINLKDVKHGSGKVRENELRQDVIKEQRKVTLFQEKLNDFNSLYTKGYISKRERDEVENNFKNTEESLNILKDKLMNYLKYEWEKVISENEIKLRELEEELESKKVQNSFELENKKIQVKKAENSLSHFNRKLHKTKKYISLCDVRAPISGIVLYKQISKSGKRRKVEVGDSIWQSQSFLQIPDTNKMIVRTYIREIDLNKVKMGMNVKVFLDAYPNKVLYGAITYIDTIADTRGHESSIKYFKTIVTIKNTEGFLRSGMSARVDIIYDKVNQALTIPIDALHYNQEQYYVYVDDFKDGTKRNIQIGRMGDKDIEVMDNLRENEVILIR